MMENERDPELDSIRRAWQAPAPSSRFHSRVMSAYRAEFARPVWWKRVSMAAAGVSAIAAILFFALPHRDSALRDGQRYVPVEQPRFIVLTQGEHP